MSALDMARKHLDYQWGELDGSGTNAECIGLPVDAVARATLALAEEQRTANLIAAVGTHDPDGRSMLSTGELADAIYQIIERLGLDA